MRRVARVLLASAPMTFAAFACSLSDEPGTPLRPFDASQDGTSDADGGAADGREDVLAGDSGSPKRLEVVCNGNPCYVDVSGNGGRHVCGLGRDGTVRCWGRDSLTSASLDGALGRGAAVAIADGAKPAPVVGLGEVTQLSVGPNLGTCARRSDGSVHCWGRNDFGQLGSPPSAAGKTVPTRVEGLPPVDEVQLGARTGCAIGSADRALYCWGEAMQGLGVESDGASTFSPRLIENFRPPLKALAIGTWNNRDTIVALLEGDVLASVGALPAGERSVETPPEQPLETPSVARIGPFIYLTREDIVRRWRLTQTWVGQPVVVRDVLYLPDSARIVDMKVSGAHGDEQGSALLATGRLFRWGVNTAGSLGVHPDLLAAATQPLEMTQLGARVVSFATTFGSTCASLVDGTISCFGTNGYGELGRGFADAVAHPEAAIIQ